MKNRRLVILVACQLLLVSVPLSAQSGCFHSPEAPTDVLMLVGGVGMFYGSSLVSRWLRGRKRRDIDTGGGG